MAPPESFSKAEILVKSLSIPDEKRVTTPESSSEEKEMVASESSSEKNEIATSVCINGEEMSTSLPKEKEMATSESAPEKKKAKPEDFTEESCLTVWWKIKMFSFCYPLLSSAEFRVDEVPYIIEVYARSNIYCRIMCLHPKDKHIEAQISFLTCDGSPEESIVCDLSEGLKVPKDVIFGNRRNSFLPDDSLTVRIQVLTNSEKEKIFMCSEMGVIRRCFFWTLKNFSNYRYEAENDEERMQKTLENSDPYGEIVMFFKPEGKVEASEHYNIQVFRKEGKASCYCQLQVYVLDTDGKALNCFDEEFAFDDEESETKVFHSILKKRDLLSRISVLLPNDTLSLRCDFAFSTGEVINEKYVAIPTEVPKFLVNDSVDLVARLGEEKSSLTDLSTDLKNVLENGPLFDVSLHVGPDVIQAHKILLSARSPVFRSIFTQGEKKTNDSIDIEGLDVETMRKLVLYTYTDTMSNYQRENTKKLYIAADKYQVLSLKRKCLSLLKSNFSISNVCDTLVFADAHGDEDMMAAALHFISENDQAFFASKEWEEIENSTLALKVMRYICSNKRTKIN